MPGFLAGRLLVVFIFLLVFSYGIAGLRSGEIRSKWHKFNRNEDPIGYWFTVLTALVGPAAIIYLVLTR